MPLETIISAIRQNKAISFLYNNKNVTVEPHHLGVFGKNLQIHSYLITPLWYSGEKWRNFIVEKIKNVIFINSEFSPQLSYNPFNCRYSEIYISACGRFSQIPANIDDLYKKFKP